MADIVIPYNPQARQIKFHECTATEVLYGGAAGGGKSEAILFDALSNALFYPGCKMVVFRRTFPDLKRSLILRSLQVYPKELARYNQSDKKWFFYNGSTIEFAYWDSDANYTNYQGAEYDFVYWDELTQFKEEWYLYMLSRLRGTLPIPRQVKAATNPGGVGHGFVKGRFIDDAVPEQVREFPPTEEMLRAGVTKTISRCFIPATVHDNPALMQADPMYIARLMALPEKERRALMDGDWDVFAGQYFREFRRHLHVVQSFSIPHHWPRYRSIDWGFNDHCAVYWHTVGDDGHTYTYRELYIRETLASDVAQRIVELTGNEEIRYTVASPDMWQNRGNEVRKGETVAETFRKNGVGCVKADDSRILGWMRVRENLAMAPDERPYWMIFDNCVNLIRTLPLLIHDDKRVEDVKQEGLEDHAADSIRYFHMSKPSPYASAFPVLSGGFPGRNKRVNFDQGEDDDDDNARKGSSFYG